VISLSVEDGDDLRQRKAALRLRMRGIRNAIPAEERIRLAGDIEANLFELPHIEEAGTILLFYSFGSEVPTARILQRLMDGGKRVLLPFLSGPSMEATELRPGDPLVATAYGPKEPARRAPVDAETIDAVIAPGLAFDRRGYRLGYGGGHYDTYLARLRRETPRVGIAFHLQLLPAVPHGSGDQPLALVVTERETVDCALHRDAG
jgi:5-formyltetrahydrofolate cyclo-ligase